MEDLKEYIVTLHSSEDLDAFYEDMETPGGTLFIPDRLVQVSTRRPTSRNTHYLLTAEEANHLREDPRVRSVSLTIAELGIKIRPVFIQTSTQWNKAEFPLASHRNWGLLRCVDGAHRTGWGDDFNLTQSGTIQVNAEGRNVDVIIMDGHIDPNHPEFAVDSTGQGNSRVNQYNWFRHDTEILEIPSIRTYIYPPYVDEDDLELTSDNNHGAHVAGTACGNSQGWARSSNIYNISPYSSNTNPINFDNIFDYIREFHRTKTMFSGFIDSTAKQTTIVGVERSIDLKVGMTLVKIGGVPNTPGSFGGTATITSVDTNTGTIGILTSDFNTTGNIEFNAYTNGRKNPTIVNCSWGLQQDLILDPETTTLTVQGITISVPLTVELLRGYGIFADTIIDDGTEKFVVTSQFKYAPYDADIEDAISEGIIFTAASGNVGYGIELESSIDYDNNLTDGDVEIYYHQGGTPDATPGVISVGNIGTTIYEFKNTTSNCGPRVNIFAPGSNIISSTHTGGVQDPRNPSYFFDKYSGTSMASPQVCGVISCLAEIYPNLTTEIALNYLNFYSKKNQISNSSNDRSDNTSLQGSPNNYLFYFKERKDQGNVFPKINCLIRPTSGQVFPRPRIVK